MLLQNRTTSEWRNRHIYRKLTFFFYSSIYHHYVFIHIINKKIYAKVLVVKFSKLFLSFVTERFYLRGLLHVDALKFSPDWNFTWVEIFLGYMNNSTRVESKSISTRTDTKNTIWSIFNAMICKWKNIVKKGHVTICLTFTKALTKFSKVLDWTVARF